MTDLDGFEGRLLHALTDLDARRAVSSPADTATRSRPPSRVDAACPGGCHPQSSWSAPPLSPRPQACFRPPRRRCDGSSPASALTVMARPTERSGSASSTTTRRTQHRPETAGSASTSHRTAQQPHRALLHPPVAHADEVLFTALPGG